MDITRNEFSQLDHQLCFALYSTSLAMTKAYRPFLKKWNVTYPQYIVLMALWKADGVTVSSLGEDLFLDSGTLTPLLKRMEATELVVRKRSPQDERQVLVTLTAKGRELRQDLFFLPEKMEEATQCRGSDLAPLTRRLKKIRTSLIKFQDRLDMDEAGCEGEA